MSATTRKRRTAGKKATATRKRRATAVKTVATRRARTAAPARRRGHELNAADIVAFVATADGTRARDFYGSVMGLRLVADEPFALMFDANGVMLRVQKVEAVNPVAYTIVGWRVADITATVRGLSAKGVVFERYPGLSHDDLGVWTSPRGARVAWFKDPDGNILSLTQF
jgi:catechol 2,3-dioxygenase-like lactoylglutathione lyase family enzyme